MTLASMEWRESAGCTKASPDLFFPEGEEGIPRPRAEYEQAKAEAKGICAACPVQAQCLEFAVLTHQKFGIWGGMTGKERRRYRSDLQRKTA